MPLYTESVCLSRFLICYYTFMLILLFVLALLLGCKDSKPSIELLKSKHRIFFVLPNGDNANLRSDMGIRVLLFKPFFDLGHPFSKARLVIRWILYLLSWSIIGFGLLCLRSFVDPTRWESLFKWLDWGNGWWYISKPFLFVISLFLGYHLFGAGYNIYGTLWQGH